MNEEEKKRIEKEAKEELKKDMESKANGGRIGYKSGLSKKFLELFKAKKISREQAKKQILEDKNIRFCILSNMDCFDYDDAANEILDNMKSTIMLVHNKKGESK